MQQDLVLLGGGHANIQVLRNFGMLPMPGVRVTLITLEAETPYSGMLPGFLSGFYTFDEMHIDLVRLTQWAGARLILANAQGIDTQGQTVLLCDRPSQHYDVLSINVGICPALSPVLGAEANVIPVKPISRLVSRLEALLIRANAADLPLQVAVVGGGASGVELACAISYRLMRERRAAGIMSTTVTVSLISRGPILQKFDRGIRKAFLLLLQERGIVIHEAEGGVAKVLPSTLVLANGRQLAFDECLWSTQAGSAGWLADTGLPIDSDGFLLVDEYLKSAGGPSNVFAAGDVASSITCPRPKAGVFAVRAGAPLAHNLRRTLSGGPLRRWAPQATFLSLITAGDRHAVATKGGWLGMQGRWVWQVKDCIDRAFVNRFGADLDHASMERHALPARALHPSLSTNELRLHAAAKGRCGGCGSKIGGASLRRVLQQLSTSANVQHGVLVGFIQADDAAVLELPPLGHVAVQSVDFFRASGFVTDPYLLGQIAANHALSDIHAMGATPQSALAVAVVPFAALGMMEDELHQMMAGALSTMLHSDCALVGGHSSEGTELALGFAVYGSAPRNALLTLRGMRVGQTVILTKPIGTGTLLAAAMQGGSRGRWVTGAVESMKQSNGPALAVLRAHHCQACTDVTGFGLLGHLAEMARASKVVVSLSTADVPLLDGALSCASAGYLSSLHPENKTDAAQVVDAGTSLTAGMFSLLVDPQTAGGLLASLPDERAESCIEALRRAGYSHAAAVGRVASKLPERSTVCVSLSRPL